MAELIKIMGRAWLGPVEHDAAAVVCCSLSKASSGASVTGLIIDWPLRWRELLRWRASGQGCSCFEGNTRAI